MSFTGPLTITQTDKWRVWRLEEPLTYEVKCLGSRRKITAPRGYLVDGASIPRLLWWLLPTWGRYSRATVPHDYLYDMLKAGTPHKEGQTRKQADAVFLEAMGVCRVSWLVRHGMWAAVRLFGGSSLVKSLSVAS